MSKTISWPTRVIYVILALALALSVAMVALPKAQVGADPGTTKWSMVTTPSETDWVIAQDSDIHDFAIGPDCKTIYAVGRGYEGNDPTNNVEAQIWKSDDAGVTWGDITANVEDDTDFDAATDSLDFVAVAPDNADFLAVAGMDGVDPFVYGSDNGGDGFSDTVFTAVSSDDILCLDISADRDDTNSVAVGTDGGDLFIYIAGSIWGGTWTDATTKAGWDNSDANALNPTITTASVTSVAFSPNWAADDTILCLCAVEAGLHAESPDATYQQSGIWGTTKTWNAQAGSPFSAAVKIIDAPPLFDKRGPIESGTGIALPEDFTGYDAGLRYNWVYVNWDTDISTTEPTGFDAVFNEVGQIFRIKGSTVTYAGIACERWDTSASYPLMASISMYGEIEDGSLMVGLLGEPKDTATVNNGDPTGCCAGVQVYRTSDWPIDYCCPQWSSAKKPPTGEWNSIVAYCPDGSKAYAATSSEGEEDSVDDWDESAFSMSEVEEVGKYWNQPSLVDTFIDYLSDMAVNPSCGTIYVFSINTYGGACGCDSVWMSTDDGDSYLRVFCKSLVNDYGLIRNAPEETAEILTVYLVDRDTKTIYWNDNSGLTNWTSRKVSTLDNVWDLAVESEDTIYALEGNGDSDVSMSDKHGGPGSWSSATGSEVDEGHSIVCRDGHVLVGGTGGKVGYSDDSADSFTDLGDIGNGLVHCAFDTYFDENDYVYAAVSNGDNGVYRTTIDDADFKSIKANTAYDYFGVVTELRKDGNPETSASTGGVLYAVYDTPTGSGVARQLTPAKATCCGGLSWDYLTAKLDTAADFTLEPTALKICGCLSPSTNSNLYAIDNNDYRMSDGEIGTPWVYEDCFAKYGIDLSSVADGSTVAADPCFCTNEKFVLTWDRLCNACEYEFQISLDEDFTQIVLTEAFYGVSANGFYDPPSNKSPSVVIGQGDLDCNTEYFWRVRAHYAETDEEIRSWWSDVWSFTVEAGPSVALTLTSPDDGASNVPLSGIGFTWASVSDATSYDFLLSADADLSSPIESKTGLTSTAYTYGGTLDNSTTYFWQVTAMKNGSVFSASDVSTFSSVPPPAPAPAPPAPTPTPPLPTTPGWVWVVIGIGAVLVITVIVLIFRTRRV